MNGVLAFLVTLVCLTQRAKADAAVGTCSKFDLDGVAYDLSPLVQTTVPYEYAGTTTSGEPEVFYGNICGALDMVEKGCAEAKGLAAVSAVHSGSQGCKVLGQSETAVSPWTHIDKTKPASGLTASFLTKDTKCKTVFNIYCDPAASPSSFKSITSVQYLPETCQATFNFASSQACSTTPAVVPAVVTSSGHSTAVILFVVAIVVYCGGGILFNMRDDDRQGIEKIPHYYFWRELPSAVAEACEGLKATVLRALGRDGGSVGGLGESGSSSRYSEI